MTFIDGSDIPALVDCVSFDNNGSVQRRKVSWGSIDSIILDETDFSNEREAVVDALENNESRVARLKAAHRARVVERRKTEDEESK